MCDLTDYNTCPHCGSVLHERGGFDECVQCGWKCEILNVPHFLTEADVGTTITAVKSGKTYTMLEGECWLCIDDAKSLSPIELYATEGDEYE